MQTVVRARGKRHWFTKLGHRLNQNLYQHGEHSEGFESRKVFRCPLPKSLRSGWGHEEGFRSCHLTVYSSGCEVRKSEPARKQLALCRSHSCCAALHTRHTRLWDRTPGVQPHTWGEPLMLLFVVRSYWCYLSLCKFYVDSYLVANFYCLITKGRTRDALADVTVFPEAPSGYFQKPLFSVASMLVISFQLPSSDEKCINHACPRNPQISSWSPLQHSWGPFPV